MVISFNVAIIGAGVTGTALAFVLSQHYPNVGRIALIEMGNSYGAVNTAPTNNSQTLHDGSIETNYSPEKAEKVSHATNLLVKYLHDYASEDVFKVGHKMVIAVGEEEVAELRALLNSEAQQILQDSRFSKVLVTDSLHIPESKRFEKLEIVSLTGILAQVIINSKLGESIRQENW